jgi:hypothetical protein
MDADISLLIVLAACIAPVGLIPLAVWLHDRIGAVLDTVGVVLIALAAIYAMGR